jgi:hypothetical protein
MYTFVVLESPSLHDLPWFWCSYNARAKQSKRYGSVRHPTNDGET